MLRIFAVISLAIIVLTSMAAADQVNSEDLLNLQTSEQISSILEQYDEGSELSGSVTLLLKREAMEPVYAERDFRPLWQDGPRLHPAARILIEHLRGAAEQGLCSDAYLTKELEDFLRFYDGFFRYNLPLAPFNRALFDLYLTQAFLNYAAHLVEGQVDPALTHVDWRARRRKADLTKLLNYAIQNNRLQQVLDGLMPQHEGYRTLMSALETYREISALGGWHATPAGPSIRLGEMDERLPVLRQRLVITGDIEDESATSGLQYSAADQVAVKRFQSRHGLVVDGIVGVRTLAALNVPVEQRIRQIELNLERWRWLPKTLGKRHIQVNIAAFSLNVVEDGQTVMSMPVVVGTAYRKTPVFSASMTYLELAPTWTVPPTILREDKLPAIKADPDYLSKKHFRILARQEGRWVEIDTTQINWAGVRAWNFPGILRQDPGPWNPLGRVKFMFPNSFNVYLHDTNQPQLFKSARRSYSSGCIRVERPIELAEYLLEGVEGWGRERLLTSMQSTQPIRVGIEPLPVHIQYWTAWVDPDGIVNFRQDIYYRDLDLEVALSEPDYQVEDHLDLAQHHGTGNDSAL